LRQQRLLIAGRRISCPGQRWNGSFLFPGPRIGTYNLRFNEQIIRPTDHHKMFDVIAPDKNKLALPIEIEGVNDAETRLARAPGARHMQPSPKGEAENKQNQKCGDEQSHRTG
jgi:hypothetical protein